MSPIFVSHLKKRTVKKLFLLTVLGLTLLSCEKEITYPPTRPVVVTTNTTTTKPKQNPLEVYNMMIINNHPTKQITGVYIDNVLQELDSGSYPVGYNDTVFALEHDIICEYMVYGIQQCTTQIRVEYASSPEFNKIVIERYHNINRTALYEVIPINKSSPCTVIWQGGYPASNFNTLRPTKNKYPWKGPLVVRAN